MAEIHRLPRALTGAPEASNTGGHGFRARRGAAPVPPMRGAWSGLAAPAPLAKAVSSRVLHGRTWLETMSSLVDHYGVSAGVPARYSELSASVSRLHFARTATLPACPCARNEVVPGLLRALHARRKGEGRFAPLLCTPHPARAAAARWAVRAIGAFAPVRKGLSRPLRSSPAGNVKTPAHLSVAGAVTIRGHRLPRLYRASNLARRHDPSNTRLPRKFPSVSANFRNLEAPALP